eukprot:Gregarina_sp_Poly_1__7783@NODE_43_length_18077_cov_117_559078_g37_i0_p9_GENE_NODE_43_length_18077_cov_117_559078_g37_i0NODE_43_length_18077_cov_117_559078_g37_i0_p9_ORF_typecomplete_len343_score25_25_NODE_43_length_18077_cov_117_559078_g37_i01329714325
MSDEFINLDPPGNRRFLPCSCLLCLGDTVVCILAGSRPIPNEEYLRLSCSCSYAVLKNLSSEKFCTQWNYLQLDDPRMRSSILNVQCHDSHIFFVVKRHNQICEPSLIPRSHTEKLSSSPRVLLHICRIVLRAVARRDDLLVKLALLLSPEASSSDAANSRTSSSIVTTRADSSWMVKVCNGVQFLTRSGFRFVKATGIGDVFVDSWLSTSNGIVFLSLSDSNLAHVEGASQSWSALLGNLVVSQYDWQGERLILCDPLTRRGLVDEYLSRLRVLFPPDRWPATSLINSSLQQDFLKLVQEELNWSHASYGGYDRLIANELTFRINRGETPQLIDAIVNCFS